MSHAREILNVVDMFDDDIMMLCMPCKCLLGALSRHLCGRTQALLRQPTNIYGEVTPKLAKGLRTPVKSLTVHTCVCGVSDDWLFD